MLSLSANFPIISLLLIVSFFTILWPLIFSARSIIHKIGIILHLGLILFFAVNIIFALPKIILNSSWQINLIYGYVFSLKTSKIGIIFIGLLSILWPASYLYSLGYLESTSEGNDRRFLTFLNLSFFFCICIALAGNLITMFVFYELLTLSTIPMIANNYTHHVNKALKKYITYLLGSSLLFFLPSVLYISAKCNGGLFSYDGFLAHYQISSSELMILLLMFLFGCAKAAIFPVYGWLPSAMAANYPTSSVLHGVLVVNSGIYCIIKIIYEVFGHPIVNEIVIEYPFILYLPSIGVIYSGIKSIFQDTAKKILAWSTVCYLNLIILVTLSPVADTPAIPLFILIIHSFAKITLFFACGCIYVRTRSTRLEDFNGSFSLMPIASVCFISSSIMFFEIHFLHLADWKEIIINSSITKEKTFGVFIILISSFFSLVSLGRIIIEICTKKNDLEIHDKVSSSMTAANIYTSILAYFSAYFSDTISEFLSALMG